MADLQVNTQSLLQRKSLLERKKELLLKKQSLSQESTPQDIQVDPLRGVTTPGFKPRSFPKDVVETGLGFIEGRTFGAPRAAIEATTDYEIPRGNAVGQLLGSILSGKGAFDLARKIPGLSKSLIRTGALTSAAASQTPQFTELEATPGERAGKATGAALIGAGVGAIPGAAKVVSKVPGTVTRFAANIPSKTQKDLRNILKRVGGKRLSEEPLDRPEFIGDVLAPKAESIARQRAVELNPETLKRLKIPKDTIDEALSLSKKFGFKKLPTTKEADDFFEKAIDSASKDSRIHPVNLQSKISELEGTVDPRDLKKVTDALQKESVPGDPFSGVGGLRPQSYKKIRAMLNDLSEAGSNPFFQQIKNAFDDDAAVAIPKINEAKALFRVSRSLEKAQTFREKPDLDIMMESVLRRSSDPKNTGTRKLLSDIIGKERADELIDLSQANRILTSPGELGRPEGSGIFSSLRGLSRRGIRKFEEKSAPKIGSRKTNA